MDNKKDFTKAEFLSFLYAEKSREIENNSIPGWSKWALLGAIASVIVYLYHTFIDNYTNYDYKIIVEYIVFSTSLFLLVLIYSRFHSDTKMYISGKVRQLKDEAPIILYIFQFVLCLFDSIIEYYYWGFSIIFFWLLIALIINAYILVYIYINQNKFVLARFKTQVFIKWKFDSKIHSALAGVYGGVIVLSLVNFIQKQRCFYQSEFEFIVGLLVFIILVYILLKIIKKKSVADDLDRLINQFVVGAISKDDAFKKYILIMYGASAYQTIENDLEIIENIKDNYNNKIGIINGIKGSIQSEEITLDNLKTIQQTLAEDIHYYSESMSSLSKLLDKIQEISMLGVPVIVDTEFRAVIDKYKKASDLFSELIKQTKSVVEDINQKYICKKYGGFCFDYNCSHRNERLSLKYKIYRQISFYFKINLKKLRIK